MATPLGKHFSGTVPYVLMVCAKMGRAWEFTYQREHCAGLQGKGAQGQK